MGNRIITTVGLSEPVEQKTDNILVKVKIFYPENYKGKRFLPEGVREVSLESAKLFESKGYAHIITDNSDSSIDQASSDSEDPISKLPAGEIGNSKGAMLAAPKKTKRNKE